MVNKDFKEQLEEIQHTAMSIEIHLREGDSLQDIAEELYELSLYVRNLATQIRLADLDCSEQLKKNLYKLLAARMY